MGYFTAFILLKKNVIDSPQINQYLAYKFDRTTIYCEKSIDMCSECRYTYLQQHDTI